MQKQICEQWASDSALRRALFPWDQSPVLFLHWCFEPALDVEYDPLLRGMLLHCPQQEILIEVVKEAFDVQVQNPVIAPASLSRLAHGIQCRLPRTISEGICMKHPFQYRLQSCLHNLLCDSICHCGDSQSKLHMSAMSSWAGLRSS